MKKTPSRLFLIFISLFLVLPLLALAVNLLTPTRAVRGKSPAAPLTDELTPEQALAQDLALADSRVQGYTLGHRSEVMGVRVVGQHFTQAAGACATADCRQVEIYLFDQDAAVTALVNVDAREVLDVLYQPGVHPGINKRLADLAMELALNDPRLVEQLGFRPQAALMAPNDAGLLDSACVQGHYCVAPIFEVNNGAVWVFVDLTDEQVIRLAWTGMAPNLPGGSVPYWTDGCPPAGAVNQDGWSLSYETTGTDSLRVYDVTYYGRTVLTSAKLVEWHADYGVWGFEDSTGCGGGGGGFPIYPYGDTQVNDLYDDIHQRIGFEVVQDFRMGNWGNSCNYRYEQHFQFFTDGRYRVVAGAYGKGCATNGLYKPLVRIDVAVDGDEGDSFATWDGSNWVTQTNENWWLQGEPYTPESYLWRLSDQGGLSYYVEPGQGQFGDGGRGDDAYLYVVQHHPEEGDTDLGVIGDCCLNDYQQGPHIYLNNESIENQNLVVWYVPQMLTDVMPGSYYCWTITGEPDPETYPCFGGPMFHPSSAPAFAGFEDNGPIQLGETAVFANTTTGSEPISYTWDFGDGVGTSTEANPTYVYSQAGTFLVTLTATNEWGSNSTSRPFTVGGFAPEAGFEDNGPIWLGETAVFTNTTTGSDPLSYFWDFGDGIGTSTEANPTYIYAASGTYSVTLSVSSEWGSSAVGRAFVVNLRHPIYLPLLRR
ncbi:MAG: PKD domain-containing protein [Chloroflexota bacterium]